MNRGGIVPLAVMTFWISRFLAGLIETRLIIQPSAPNAECGFGQHFDGGKVKGTLNSCFSAIARCWRNWMIKRICRQLIS